MSFTPEEQAAQLRKPNGSGADEIFEYMNRGNQVLYPAMLRHLDIPKNGNVLELGQGNGMLVADILQSAPGVTYAGIDFSESSCKAAAEKNKSWVEKGMARFEHGEIQKMPFANHQFDVVLGTNIFYFWENPAAELAEISRVIKPGGRLVFGYRSKSKLGQLPFTQFGFTLYDPSALQNMMEILGWEHMQTQTFQEPSRNWGEITIEMECHVSIFRHP